MNTAASSRQPGADRPQRKTFEQPRGVCRLTQTGEFDRMQVALASGDPFDADVRLEVLRRLHSAEISINLVKVHRTALSFVLERTQTGKARSVIEDTDTEPKLSCEITPEVTLIFAHAAGMQSLSGIMGRVTRTLQRAETPILQLGDSPDALFLVVEQRRAARAIRALRDEFDVPTPAPPLIVQKFGGKCVATPEARAQAAQRVQEALDQGMRPVVVVSAIGRRGEPYATDTLLDALAEEAPDTPINPRDRDLLMACGEIISTVIMSQALRRQGIRAIPLTGGQAGIQTDPQFGDAQIQQIDPTHLLSILDRTDVDVVVVAGFQGVTEDGLVTTLGRGGSDTTASALGVALSAAAVEIYTHVEGIMTADPEVDDNARTLAVVTYEEVCNMAHLGAKVIHPRAAEIAMTHQIPLWVKSSFSGNPGTRVAGLEELQPPSKRAVTGVATLADLAYFRIEVDQQGDRSEAECRCYEALGAAGINLSLVSRGPNASSFIVTGQAAMRAAVVLDGLGVRNEYRAGCDMVSLVAVNMWEEAGFMLHILEALHEAGVEILQMADSEGAVSCLVDEEQAPAAVRALHQRFLGSS